MDTLWLAGEKDEFERCVQWVSHSMDLNIDKVTVQSRRPKRGVQCSLPPSLAQREQHRVNVPSVVVFFVFFRQGVGWSAKMAYSRCAPGGHAKLQ